MPKVFVAIALWGSIMFAFPPGLYAQIDSEHGRSLTHQNRDEAFGSFASLPGLTLQRQNPSFMCMNLQIISKLDWRDVSPLEFLIIFSYIVLWQVFHSSLSFHLLGTPFPTDYCQNDIPT